MGYSRQKTVMYIVSTTSLLAILGALYAFRDGLVESWYLYRLNSNDVTTREKCIGQLSRFHSVRAVPKLIELAAASMTLSKTLDIYGLSTANMYLLEAVPSMGRQGLSQLAMILCSGCSEQKRECCTLFALDFFVQECVGPERDKVLEVLQMILDNPAVTASVKIYVRGRIDQLRETPVNERLVLFGPSGHSNKHPLTVDQLKEERQKSLRYHIMRNAKLQDSESDHDN